MRDGARLKADVFRPDDGGKFPAILNLGPYQKDKLWVPPPQLEEKATPNMNWETVTPEWWVPKGYAAVRVDGRGSGKSPGQCEPWSLAEAIDFYDAIEWAAAQPWCNGKVGLSGISYFAINQWFVANLQPPSLEGDHPVGGLRRHLPRRAVPRRPAERVHDQLGHRASDASRHGPRRAASARTAGRPTRCGTGCTTISTAACCAASQAQWDKITVPMLTVGNWTGFALHLRGNTEAYMRAASKHKKLRIHNGSHVHPFYTDEGKRDQLRFLDYWLKGIDNGVMDEPPVKLAIRKGKDEIEWRDEHEWPLKRTQWTKFYFDISEAADGKEPRVGALVREKPAKASSCTYPAFNLGTMGSTSAASSQVMGGGIKPGMGIALSTPPMTEDTEITGPLAATFHVSSESEDMDLFLTLRHFDADGNEIMETGQQGTPVPVAKGWLRASHRELDPELSLPYRPYHKHTRRLFLKPGEIVKVDVEIWPTSMTFKKGHRIQLDVQPRDGVGSQSYLHYHADYNTGTNTIYAGGEYESYLLLPVIPKS